MAFENVRRAKNPRTVNGGGSRTGEDPRRRSGSVGELGRLEPMVNLVPDL